MRIEQIKILALLPFVNHPFKIRQNDEMVQMRESIQEYGIITPILARPLDSGYEVISGHLSLST